MKASSWRPSATVAAFALLAAIAAWMAAHWFVAPKPPAGVSANGVTILRAPHAGSPSAVVSPPRSTDASLNRSAVVETAGNPREDALCAVTAAIRADEIPETLQWLQSGESDELTRELSLRLVRSWAESDPRAAAAWTTQLPVGPTRDGALDQVAIAWANREFEAAAQWARQLTEVEKQNALRAIAQEVLRTNPVKALQFSIELSPGETRDALLRHGVAEWAMTDADKAIGWVQQIPDKALREQLLAAAALSWSESNPLAASKLVAAQVPAGRLRADAMIGIVQRWAQQDRRQAAAWVDSFLDDDLRPTAIEVLNSAARHSL